MTNAKTPVNQKILTKKIMLFVAIITYTTAIGLPVLLEVMAR